MLPTEEGLLPFVVDPVLFGGGHGLNEVEVEFVTATAMCCCMWMEGSRCVEAC